MKLKLTLPLSQDGESVSANDIGKAHCLPVLTSPTQKRGTRRKSPSLTLSSPLRELQSNCTIDKMSSSSRASSRTRCSCILVIWILSTLSVLLFSTTGVLGDNLALLTGTLRTYQKAACDGEYMILRCPSGTTISVQLAQYGKSAPSPGLCQSVINAHPALVDSITDPYNNITCQLPNAIQTVVGLCQKKTSCKFSTSPGTFGGDPCPSSRKYVEVAYKCRPSEFKSVIGCEAETIQLKCNRSSRLAIYSANYGRTEYESVQCPQPNGVHEESCLSSFATETVMQMCHGKRRCALGVHPVTFGNPCKPESKAYMKVIFTCVPRKVLKEQYQGEPEPDEMFDDETEDETGDSVGGVVEQPSIYSPDHSKGWVNPKSTPQPSSIPSKSHSSGEQSILQLRNSYNPPPSRPTSMKKSSPEQVVVVVKGGVRSESTRAEVRDEGGTDYGISNEGLNSPHDGHIIYLISQGIRAYDFVSQNSGTLWLYITIITISCLLVIISVITVKIWIQHRAGLGPSGCTTSKPSSSSAGPISTGGLSDIDELSVVMDDVTELPSILRKSSSCHQNDDLVSNNIAVSTVTSTSKTLTRNSAIAISGNCSSNTSSLIPTTMTLGRGLNRTRESTNIRFYYD